MASIFVAILRRIFFPSTRTISERRAQPGCNVRILESHHKLQLQYYICIHCSKLLVEPVYAEVGHRYCKKCYIARGRAKTRCPWCVMDHIPIEDDCVLLGAFYPDNAAVRDIDKMSAECLTRSCGYQGSMKEMEDHVHVRG